MKQHKLHNLLDKLNQEKYTNNNKLSKINLEKLEDKTSKELNVKEIKIPKPLKNY